jgi:hypothetical protein
MRRLIYLLILTVFVSASVTCVSASTDCERWFVAYRQELAHTRSLQRIAAAKRRAKQRLASYVKPAPKPVVPAKRGPGLTRHETLHRIDLACGVLPENDSAAPLVAEETPAPLNDGIDLLPAPLGDLIAENDVPPMPTIGVGDTNILPTGGAPISIPAFGGFGGSSVPPPGTPPPTKSSPPPSGTLSAPPPPVPEPASYVFMLTGLAGIAGEVRRRFKA